MSDFKVKMNLNRFPLGLWTRSCWGSLHCSSTSPSCNKGDLRL